MPYNITIEVLRQVPITLTQNVIDANTQLPTTVSYQSYQWQTVSTRTLNIPKTKSNFDLISILNQTSGVSANGTPDATVMHFVRINSSSDDENPTDVSQVFQCGCGSVLFDTELDLSAKPLSVVCQNCFTQLAVLQ